jgi:hypothetical protein
MAEAMGVSLKTENEEYAGKSMQIRGSEGGRRGFTGIRQQGLAWRIPRWPSARLTHGLKPVAALWLLRCSVFRETPMAFSCNYFKKLNCYDKSRFSEAQGAFGKAQSTALAGRMRFGSQRQKGRVDAAYKIP